jgi:hypothetical protein
MKASAGVSLLAAIVLGLLLWTGGQRANAARPPEPGISRTTAIASSSRLILDGRVRCTATVAPEVEVGRTLTVEFALRNVSRRPVKVQLWVFSSGLLLHAADGTTYDTSAPLEALPGIPPPIPAKLAPGATRNIGSQEVPVRWPGPLRITPSCEGKTLPVLHVRVDPSAPPADDSAAIDDVVAAAGHLLDRCRPQTPGVPVDGRIDPPGGDAAPLEAQCSVSLESEGSFSVAQVLVVTPPSLPGVQIFQPYETLWPVGRFVPLPSSPPYEAIAWEFVVTSYGAAPVAASTLYSTKDSSRTVTSWEWNGTGWRGGGSGSCGGTGFASGGTGPFIAFISACSR